jgi:hypothetical protein
MEDDSVKVLVAGRDANEEEARRIGRKAFLHKSSKGITFFDNRQKGEHTPVGFGVDIILSSSSHVSVTEQTKKFLKKAKFW